MRIGKPSQIVLATLGAVLTGIGLGVLIVNGLSDLAVVDGLVGNAASYLIAGIVGLTLIVVLTGRTFADSPSLQWLRHRHIMWIVLGSLLLAVLSIRIAGIDAGNNTAWRSTTSLTTSPEINRQQKRELGRYFVRLSVPAYVSAEEPVAEVPGIWPVSISGGQSDVLIRLHGSAAADRPNTCTRQNTVRIVAAIRGMPQDPGVTINDACGQWQRAQVEMPKGTTELFFYRGDLINAGAIDVDIMIAASRPHFAWFWTLCTIIAIGATLTIVCLLSINLRQQVGSGTAAADMQNKGVRSRALKTGGLVLLFVLISNAFVVWFVSQERTIYTWDYSGYWTSSRHVSEFLRGGERKSAIRSEEVVQVSSSASTIDAADEAIPDPGALGALVRNIRFSEYNISSNIPVAPVMAVFGGSRLVYELSLLNVYALAAVLVLILTMRGIGGSAVARWPEWWPAVPISAVICLVPFWVPILRGYMGVSVAAINLAVLYLYFRQPVRALNTQSLLLIGALLLAGVVLQRWNAYWVVSFLLIVFVDSLWQQVKLRSLNLHDMLRNFRAPLVSGFAAFFLFVTFAWPKVVRTVTTDYADIYSAFQEDTGLTSALVRQLDAFGIGVFVLMMTAFVFLLSQEAYRRIATLIGLQVVVVFLHFSSTQTMGPHQYFLILPGLLVLLSLGLVAGIAKQTRWLRYSSLTAAMLLLVFGISSGASVFVPTQTGEIPSPNRLLSQSYRPPLVNGDLDEFIRLAQYIDKQMTAAPEEQGIYVLSGSEFLNSVHFDTISASTGASFVSADRVLRTSVVDKRDGFPHDLLRAHVVVTSDPVQLSRRPTDHYVISIPSERLLSGAGLGAAFERLPELFELDGGVSAVVFRRTRPNTVDEIAELSDALRTKYPDRPGIYQ